MSQVQAQPIYKVVDRRSVLVSGPDGERALPLLGWGGTADLALTILCDVFGETPSPKRLESERFKAAPHLPAFRRKFGSGLDFFPGQQIAATDVRAWLRGSQKVKV